LAFGAAPLPIAPATTLIFARVGIVIGVETQREPGMPINCMPNGELP
jgi:hypothetical protein